MPIYSDIYNGPPNGYSNTYSKKMYIAIHNTSNDASAYNEASYARRRTDSVSSHYYADRSTVIQSLNTDLKAWHAGSSTGNSRAIAYEIVGTNSKSRSWWLNNVNWDKLAKQIAKDMKHWGIKNQHLSVSQIKSGTVTGIVTHDDMRRAWGGTTHTDPGSNFPMDHLIKKVNEYLNPQEEDVADYSEAQMRAFPWQYAGGGLPEGFSALKTLNETYLAGKKTEDGLNAVRSEVAALKSSLENLSITTGDVTVSVSDEQLERVIRKVFGSVDE